MIKIRNIAIILTFFVLGFGLGNFSKTNKVNVVQVVNSMPQKSGKVDFKQFWTVWDRVTTDFVDQEKIQPQKMMEGAISGMLSSLEDPYTVYLPAQANKESKEDLNGTFDGIGAQLGLDGKKIVVIAPLEGTPAKAAGVLPKDHIYKVDGVPIDGKSLPEVVSKIRGPKGTTVKLTLKRTGEKKELEKIIKRETILVKSVTLEMKKTKSGSEIAVIKLSRFGERTNDEWMQVVSKISENKDKIKGVVLDLRNNPGGFLDSSVFVASEFLPQSTKVVSQESATLESKIYFANRVGQILDSPLVVLINGGSASASEIVAGALKDNKRAKLIGEKSFGKGSVQEAEDLEGGAGLHITIAKWVTPSGVWIHGKGIEPDIKIVNDVKKPDEDKQMERAMEELTK